MKPMWAMLLDEAADLEAQAASRREKAERYRCQVTDSGGGQCTGDAEWEPNHEHRWRETDLPR